MKYLILLLLSFQVQATSVDECGRNKSEMVEEFYNGVTCLEFKDGIVYESFLDIDELPVIIKLKEMTLEEFESTYQLVE